MDIVFAVVPFSDIKRPAIGVSTLLSGIRRAGFTGRIEYVHLQLAAWMGVELYQWIFERGDQLLVDAMKPSVSLLGEWFFASVLFPGQLPPDEQYLSKFVAPDPRGRELIGALLDARDRYAARFVKYAAHEILRNCPRIVGITSAFYQTCCGLAVAKALKQAENPPVVIFGGANCEGEMGVELIRSFPWIDYVCTGEGDEVLPEFLDRYLRRNHPEPPPGILRQGFEDALFAPRRIPRMDDLPVPDFHDYFDQLEACGLNGIEPVLTVETEASLHLLRTQWRQHGVQKQIAGACCCRDDGVGGDLPHRARALGRQHSRHALYPQRFSGARAPRLHARSLL
jgi:hypothetical protein